MGFYSSNQNFDNNSLLSKLLGIEEKNVIVARNVTIVTRKTANFNLSVLSP